MKIVIGGAGDVGCHLAKLLSQESHDITVIDLDKGKLTRLSSTLDIMTYQGDITAPLIQEQAEIEQSDIFIAVTDRQDTNICAGLLAKKLGAQKVIIRVKNAEYLDRKYAMILHRMGIDVIISPEEQAANEIINLIEAAILTKTHSFGNHLLNLFGITLGEQSPILGLSVEEILTKYNTDNILIPICIVRTDSDSPSGHRSFVPAVEDILQQEDLIYFIALEEARNSIYEMSGKIRSYLSNIIILGGGEIGTKAAELLQTAKHRVKVIERDRQRAEKIADQLGNVLVIAGDGRDSDLLVEEGIGEVDAFVAMTGRSETNMVACLLAKSKGIKKNIALVDNTDYIQLSKAIGIDSFINKKLLTANAILKYIRKGKVIDVISLYDAKTSVMEFRVNEKSAILSQSISDIELPPQTVIAGIVRKNKAYIATPDWVVERFDRIVVFSHNSSISKLETIF